MQTKNLALAANFVSPCSPSPLPGISVIIQSFLRRSAHRISQLQGATLTKNQPTFLIMFLSVLWWFIFSNPQSTISNHQFSSPIRSARNAKKGTFIRCQFSAFSYQQSGDIFLLPSSFSPSPLIRSFQPLFVFHCSRK